MTPAPTARTTDEDDAAYEVEAATELKFDDESVDDERRDTNLAGRDPR